MFHLDRLISFSYLNLFFFFHLIFLRQSCVLLLIFPLEIPIIKHLIIALFILSVSLINEAIQCRISFGFSHSEILGSRIQSRIFIQNSLIFYAYFIQYTSIPLLNLRELLVLIVPRLFLELMLILSLQFQLLLPNKQFSLALSLIPLPPQLSCFPALIFHFYLRVNFCIQCLPIFDTPPLPCNLLRHLISNLQRMTV